MPNKPYWSLICMCILLLTACVAPRGAGELQTTSQQVATQSVTMVATIFPNNPPTTCPITHPPNVPLTPPSPYPATPPSRYVGQFWYGTANLWTMLGADGTWASLPHSKAGYSQKVFWWAQSYDVNVEPIPKLTVTGKRLDAPAPPFLASSPTNASADFGEAMLVGGEIPTLGCWEITGQYNGYELSFVVWIAP
jgi:hypothetical protein